MRVPPKIGTIKLITAGRITGLPHVVELRYTHQDDSFYVLAGRANTDWVSNALKSESSKVHVGGLVFKVEASVLKGRSRRRVRFQVEFRRLAIASLEIRVRGVGGFQFCERGVRLHDKSELRQHLDQK